MIGRANLFRRFETQLKHGPIKLSFIESIKSKYDLLFIIFHLAWPVDRTLFDHVTKQWLFVFVTNFENVVTQIICDDLSKLNIHLYGLFFKIIIYCSNKLLLIAKWVWFIPKSGLRNLLFTQFLCENYVKLTNLVDGWKQNQENHFIIVNVFIYRLMHFNRTINVFIYVTDSKCGSSSLLWQISERNRNRFSKWSRNP